MDTGVASAAGGLGGPRDVKASEPQVKMERLQREQREQIELTW
jgi:hypothetical protein